MSRPLDNPSFGSAARVLSALGEPGRLKLMALISRRELCVCHLVSALGQPQPTVSRQLGILKSAGLVDARREGSWVHYRVARRLQPLTRLVLEQLLEGFDPAGLDAEVNRLAKKLGPGVCS